MDSIAFRDVTNYPAAENRWQVVDANNPLPVAVLSGGGGGGGTASSVKVWDGTNSASVKPASTLPAGTDVALVTTQRDATPAGANIIGFTGSASAGETGTLAATNATAGGTVDCGGYGSVSVQVTGTWAGTLTFQTSNDGVNWVAKSMSPLNSAPLTSTTTGNGMWASGVGARYFRVLQNVFTSGSAAVTIRYSSTPFIYPIAYTGRLTGGADGQQASAMDEIALGVYNNSSIDRVYNAAGAVSVGANAAQKALQVASGGVVMASLSAVTGAATGTASDNQTARFGHTIQVDVTTTTAGTAGTHTVILEGSLDGTYYTTLATVTPAATSTTATDPSNHANASVSGFPYRYVRARSTGVPTSWVGTVNARVVSAG